MMNEKERSTSAKFWETETPEEIRTSRNVLRYYPQAGRLMVHLPDYYDDAGNAKQGKGTGINLTNLAKNPAALERLIEILQDWKAKAEV